MILYFTLFAYTVYSEQLITVYCHIWHDVTGRGRAKRGGHRSVIELVTCIVSIFSKKFKF